MATLQKTFGNQGKNNPIPKTIHLSFECPVYSFSRTTGKMITRELISKKDIDISLNAQATDYEVEVPVVNLTGNDTETISKFMGYALKSMTFNDLNAISFPVHVKYLTPDNILLGSGQLEALHWLKGGTDDTNEMGQIDPNNSAEQVRFLHDRIFLVNKAAYLNALKKHSNLSKSLDDFYLFLIIQPCITIIAGRPSINKELGVAALQALVEKLAAKGLLEPEKVVADVLDNIETFFDFPLSAPALRPIDVKGDFTLVPSDNATVDKDTLLFYDLSLEYTNGTAIEIAHYDWKKNLDSFTANKISFSFSDTSPIIANSITGPLTIRVKGYDNAVIWAQDFEADDAALSNIQIKVPVSQPNVLTSLDANNDGKKLRGQLLELTKKCPLKDITVIIQAKKQGDQVARIVGAANTDGSGNFSMPYPFGDYIEAQAIVSLTPDKPADITIDTAKKNETISDDFLYLLVKEPECEPVEEAEEDDCDCHSPKKAARLPDQKDLIASDEYTQDIGGACINLSTPNRTLNEYAYQAIVRTSDPDVANYTLVKNVIPGEPSRPDKVTYDLTGGAVKITRGPVDLNNPIRWQDAPDYEENLSVYQSVTVATGHILHYKTVFKADGYSLGNLLYSLPLAPGQKKQIVIFDASHNLTGSETQSLSQAERLAAGITDEREIIDQLGGTIGETMKGKSAASTAGISAGLGVGVSVGAIGGSLGVAGGYSNSKSSASQDSSRNITQFFSEKLRQSITQNADSYRELNASVITTVQEGQRYSAETEVVSNHNHCHSLTMMYFEVLRHYAIYQELSAVEECIFVPLLLSNFSTQNIYKWSDVLAANLLPLISSTYLQPFGIRAGRQHPLLKAFDANERIKTDYKTTLDFPTGAFSDEVITSLYGYLTLKVNIPRPKTIYDRVLSFPIVQKEEVKNKRGGIFGWVADLLIGKDMEKKTWEEKVKFVDDHIIIYDNFQQAKPADVIEVKSFDNFFNNSNDINLWTAISALCEYANLESFLSNYFSHKTISQWDSVFNDEIAPAIFEKLVKDSISIYPFSTFDFTTTSRYHGGEKLMRVSFRANTSLTRSNVKFIQFFYAKAFPNAADFWQFVILNIENININYTTKNYQGVIINTYLGDSLQDGTKEIPTPLNSDEQRNPRNEDIYLVNKLIEHLNSNLEYYNKILWFNLDIDRRYMLLDGFNLQTFDDFGMPAGTRSLASVVKNELVEIVGNSLVFPVSSGYKISQSYIVAKDQQGNAAQVSLFDHYKPLTPMEPYRVSIPSKGVFMEAIQGACDACEKVKANTSQDWTKFTTDEPTSISPISVPVPTVTDWKAAFKDFATPIVNIQNAPSTPAPGAGLAGLNELLGKNDAFRDITGLAKNQDNVMSTYLSNQENAKAFAEMAKSMAMQDHNTKNSDKIMDSLKSAKDSGAISKEDFGNLTKDHLQQQIDGGETKKQEAKKDPAQSLSGAAVKAAEQGKEVKAQKTELDGSTESIEIKPMLIPAALKEVIMDFENLRKVIIAIAKKEENDNWKKDGEKLQEDNPIVFKHLLRYFNRIDGNQTASDAFRHAQRAAADQGEFREWSAAFICSVMFDAGVKREHGFDYGVRHISYIIGAMKNKEYEDKSRPFWFYSKEDLFSPVARIQEGDILCLNRNSGHYTYENLRNYYFTKDDNTGKYTRNAKIASGSSHCDIVIDIIEEEDPGDSTKKIKVLRTIGGNTKDYTNKAPGTTIYEPIENTVGFKKYLLDNNGNMVKKFRDGSYQPLEHSIIGVIKIIKDPVINVFDEADTSIIA